MTFHVEDFVVCLSEVKSRRMNCKTANIELNDVVLELLTKLVGKSGKALLRINGYATPVRVFSEPIVYEVIVQNIVNGMLILEINDECFSLIKKSPIPVDIDVCFCLIDVFQSMHSAIENINLDLLFPNMKVSKSLPESRKSQTLSDEKLSVDQRHALNVITRPVNTAPVILLGPFGAGKTMTIAYCIDRILSQVNSDNKILLCTHSNSAADHYIEEYFHPRHTSISPYAKPCNVPLRINWEHRYTSSVSDKVLTYCLQDLNTGLFKSPSKKDLERANIIICTLVTSESLYKLNLPACYFSYIFIDEAAQAMEVEALVPLLLATPKETKIVLAGDHLQMGESLSSRTAKDLGLEMSLLERLFNYYPFDLECKLKLLENFRSYKEIVDLSSHLFYEDSLICNKQRSDGVPFPVEFHGTEGEDNLSNESPSYENVAEAIKILELIQKISKEEESKDYKVELSSICVVAFYPAQVRRIRKILRKNQLYPVRVESVHNIQGLEFDILLISTVRSYSDSTFHDESLSKDMGFFTNPKLLNTAITRARYRVFFVGDARALCTIGECKPCWKYIMRYCVLYNTFNNEESFIDLIDSIKLIEESRKPQEENADENLDIIERLDLEEKNPKSPSNSIPDLSPAPTSIEQPNDFNLLVSQESSPITLIPSPTKTASKLPSTSVISPPKDLMPEQSTNTPSRESVVSCSSEDSSNQDTHWSTQSLRSEQRQEHIPSPLRNINNRVADQTLQDDIQSMKDEQLEEKLFSSFSAFPPHIDHDSTELKPLFQPIIIPNVKQQTTFFPPNSTPDLIQNPNPNQIYHRSFSAEPISQNPSSLYSPLYQRSSSSEESARHVSNIPQVANPPGFQTRLFYQLPNIPQPIPFQPTGYNMLNRVAPGDVRFVHNTDLQMNANFGQPFQPVRYVFQPFFKPRVVSGYVSPNRPAQVLQSTSRSYDQKIIPFPKDPYQVNQQTMVTSNPQSFNPSQSLSNSRQILTVPATCKLTLRHKIQFLHDYCVHVLESLNASSGMIDYIKRSTINAFQDLDSCDGVPEMIAKKILTETEVKMETNYTLVHDHLIEHSIQTHFSDSTPKAYLERLDKGEHKLLSLSIQQSNGSAKSDRTVLLEFFWKMLKFELDICRKLQQGFPEFHGNNENSIRFLEVKLSFVEVKMKEFQTLFEKFMLMNRDNPASIFNEKEQNEWFAKRRDDPYVREYQAAFDRRMAGRLPSPTPPQ